MAYPSYSASQFQGMEGGWSELKQAREQARGRTKDKTYLSLGLETQINRKWRNKAGASVSDRANGRRGGIGISFTFWERRSSPSGSSRSHCASSSSSLPPCSFNYRAWASRQRQADAHITLFWGLLYENTLHEHKYGTIIQGMAGVLGRSRVRDMYRISSPAVYMHGGLL